MDHDPTVLPIRTRKSIGRQFQYGRSYTISSRYFVGFIIVVRDGRDIIAQQHINEQTSFILTAVVNPAIDGSCVYIYWLLDGCSRGDGVVVDV